MMVTMAVAVWLSGSFFRGGSKEELWRCQPGKTIFIHLYPSTMDPAHCNRSNRKAISKFLPGWVTAVIGQRMLSSGESLPVLYTTLSTKVSK